MLFNVTFAVISWWLHLLVQDTGKPPNCRKSLTDVIT